MWSVVFPELEIISFSFYDSHNTTEFHKKNMKKKTTLPIYNFYGTASEAVDAARRYYFSGISWELIFPHWLLSPIFFCNFFFCWGSLSISSQCRLVKNAGTNVSQPFLLQMLCTHTHDAHRQHPCVHGCTHACVHALLKYRTSERWRLW